MNEKQLFDTIQVGDIPDMYREVTNAALYLATGGFLEDANKILSSLWQQGIKHDRNTWFADLSFEVLWQIKGQRPDFVPFKTSPLDTIDRAFRNYLGGDRYAYKMPDVEWHDLTGKNAFRQAQTWFSSIKYDEKTLFLLEIALEDWTVLAPHEFGSATIMAAEIAAKIGNEALALKMAQWWAEKYHDFYLNYSFPLMAQSQHIAPFLLRGVLSNALKIDKDKSKTLSNQIIDAVEKRIALGRSLVYGDLTWKKLLKKLSHLAIINAPELFSDNERKTMWLGREKALNKSILDTEKRLSIQLSEDYKAFLKVSNGLSASSNIAPPLLSIENIGWYKQMEDKELYDITKTYLDIDKIKERGTIEPYTERAILISEIPNEDLVWLIPPDNRNTGWQTWSFSASTPGEIRYQSFRHYIENWVSFFETL
jgi:hypothetical protein